MSTTSTLPTLPKDTADQLVALKGTSTEDFYALVTALCNQGWPLRAIAEPFGVSRTAALEWKKKFQGTDLPEAPPVPVRTKPKMKKKDKYVLSPEECQELRRLADLASTVRRYTYEGSPSRNAADELERYLIEYSNKGVSRVDLAKAAGVSDSSIKQRLRKYNGLDN